jgi:hypothetical protein
MGTLLLVLLIASYVLPVPLLLARLVWILLSDRKR